MRPWRLLTDSHSLCFSHNSAQGKQQLTSSLITVEYNFNMVWGRIVDAVSTPRLPEGEPTRLPNYFPVEPRGCERHAQKLFACLSGEATEKARDMEKAGLLKSQFPDVEFKATDENAAKLVASGEAANDPSLPKAGQNPLDECRTAIAYYKRCCDRELKKKKNWLLTEPYRVQEEYRYSKTKDEVANED